MKTLVIVLAFGVLCSSASIAQSVSFKILSLAGDVQVLSGSAAQSTAAKVGQLLTPKTSVRVGAKGGYCSVLANTGRVLEISKPGILDLSAIASKQSSGTMGSIVNFVETSMKGPAAKRYVGSVYRAAGGTSTVFPSDTRLLGDSVQLVWHSQKGVLEYSLLVKNDKNEIVHTMTVRDTDVTLNRRSIPKLQRGTCFYWSVGANGTPPEGGLALCWADPNEADSLRQAYSGFRTGVVENSDTQPSPMTAYLCGSWFERAGYFVEADKLYKEALRMQPEVALFQTAVRRLMAEGNTQVR